MKLKKIIDKNSLGCKGTSGAWQKVFDNNIKVVSDLRKGKWYTTVVYNDTYNLNGIAESASMKDGELTVAINDGRRHIVFRYDENGEGHINKVSKILLPHHPMALYVCPSDQNCIMVKHSTLPAIMPILDDIVYSDNVVSFHIGSATESFYIDMDKQETDSSKYVNRLYHVSVDLIDKIIEVDDVISNKIVCSDKIFKENI